MTKKLNSFIVFEFFFSLFKMKPASFNRMKKKKTKMLSERSGYYDLSYDIMMRNLNLRCSINLEKVDDTLLVWTITPIKRLNVYPTSLCVHYKQQHYMQNRDLLRCVNCARKQKHRIRIKRREMTRRRGRCMIFARLCLYIS